MGSSGQPFIQPFEGGISVAIGTKREYMPDGTPFEGVGIAPDIRCCFKTGFVRGRTIAR